MADGDGVPIRLVARSGTMLPIEPLAVGPAPTAGVTAGSAAIKRSARLVGRKVCANMSNAPEDVTTLLTQWGEGDRSAFDRLMPVVYDELHRIAERYFRRERPDSTLQPTALVNEAYVRLVGQSGISLKNRAHFFGIAANTMRRILVERARARNASKRGSGDYKLDLTDVSDVPLERSEVDLIALDKALDELASFDPQQSRIVEAKFFGGLSIEETAQVIGVSPATVKREWALAKAWLFRELS